MTNALQVVVPCDAVSLHDWVQGQHRPTVGPHVGDPAVKIRTNNTGRVSFPPVDRDCTAHVVLWFQGHPMISDGPKDLRAGDFVSLTLPWKASIHG